MPPSHFKNSPILSHWSQFSPPSVWAQDFVLWHWSPMFVCDVISAVESAVIARIRKVHPSVRPVEKQRHSFFYFLKHFAAPKPFVLVSPKLLQLCVLSPKQLFFTPKTVCLVTPKTVQLFVLLPNNCFLHPKLFFRNTKTCFSNLSATETTGFHLPKTVVFH